MNKIFLFLSFLVLFSVSDLNGQDVEDKVGITVKALLLDYQTFNGGSIGAIQSYHQGI